jgi:hypothetical protein
MAVTCATSASRCSTAFQGTVIAFSWFGVNLLGVGLHSYGFTSGIHTALWSYYATRARLIHGPRSENAKAPAMQGARMVLAGSDLHGR